MRLTLPQQDIYYEQLLHSEEPIYNIGAKIKIEGNLNIELFNKAYILMINQHDSYRTVFYKDQEIIHGKIIEFFDEDLEYLDLSNSNASEDTAHDIINDKYYKQFKITGGSFLHRFCLIKVSKNLYYFFTVCHHIITDGWGTSLMFQRLVKNYNELLESGVVTTTYPFSYNDFVVNDLEYQKSEDYINNKTYWLDKFEILPENLFQKKETYSHITRSERKTLSISRNTYNALNRQSKEYKSNTFHLLLAILYIYFGRKHQNEDFAIGLPVLNRSKSVFKKTVGLFMGVSALRIQLDFENTVQELIVSIKNQLRQDYRHQRFPIGNLIKELQIYQEKEKLFNITLSYEKQDYAHNFGDTKTSVIPLTHNSERVALAIYIREFDINEDVNIDFDYNLSYFDEDSISKVTSHFGNLLNNILDYPNKEIKELSYLSLEEENQLLTTFNNTTVDYPDSTLLHFFNEQVSKTPNKVAIVDDNKKLSYLELNDLSNKITGHILTISEEVNTQHIGVLLERSTLTIAILLGILKAGKSYIPLDPTFPTARLKYIIGHSEIKLLISDQESSNFSEIINIKANELLTKVQSSKEIRLPLVKSTDTAYIIYTSGSTGNPKGVEVGHSALLNFLLSMKQKPGIHDTDTLLAVTTYSFDISILEFFAPLIAGATVYIVDNITLKDPEKTILTIENIKPTIIQATPSFYQLLFNAGWGGDKNLKILCGGDLLSEDLAGQLLKDCGQLWNMYGPTETTIWSSVKQITKQVEASNIGSPINNTSFYILDSFKKMVPIGSSGSLFIGGDGLAKGYYRAPELTHQKFIPNPFNKGTLLYDTNDIVRWKSNGEVEFLGRNDNQVKIRGYRIELGDIETKLNNLPEIHQAIVVAKNHNKQDAFLVAYIIKENEKYKEENCISELEVELPKYMVPYVFVEVDEFPLTPNKKVDRKALALQEIGKTINHKEFQKPKTELQEKLLGYWKDVLHYNGEISIVDNFFSLGGHSLNAIKLIHLINTELSLSIRLKTLFDFPTILSLANHILSVDQIQTQNIPKCANKEYYAINPSQYEIWLASQNSNRSISYNMGAAFRIEGKIDTDKINKAVNQLILKHEILRTNFIEVEGSVFQKVIDIETIDFMISIDSLEENKATEKIQQFINIEYNLEHDLLLKMMLINISETCSYLVFCTHHIIMDGWSLELFTNDFLHYYEKSPAPELLTLNHIQFKDYTEWYKSQIETQKENRFWENYLNEFQFKESFISNTKLENNLHNGNQLAFELSKEETSSLKAFLRKNEKTLHSFLITALNILIYKFSGHDDIVLGTVNSGRSNSELDNMIGMFVKTLPLRSHISIDDSLESALNKVQEGVLQIGNNQDVPSHYKNQTLFDIIVAFQNPEFSYQENIELNGANLYSHPIELKYSRVPLLFNFFETNNILSSIISFNSQVYDEEMVSIIILKYKKLINNCISNPSTKIVDLDIALDFEKQKTVDINFSF